MKKTIFLLLLATLFPNSFFSQQPSADLILFHGRIFTAVPDQNFTEAIAIKGERILAVGSDDVVTKLAGARTRLIDLQGRTVIPGINDAHFHFMPDPQGFQLQFHTSGPGLAETLAAVKDAVGRVP